MQSGRAIQRSRVGMIATVFGCTGFLGRYVVNRLARLGAQVVAPYRGEEKYINHLKVMGELGQIVPVAYSIRDKNSVERAVMRSDVVINLLGSWWDTRNFTMEEANVTAARTIAEVCSKRGVSRFIQASALHANEDSPSRFARVKGQAEKAVREAFPKATIIRSATILGREDRILNKFGALTQDFPFTPLLFSKDSMIQPINVIDLCYIYGLIAEDKTTAGKIFEIGGPEKCNWEYFITDIIQKGVKRERTILTFSYKTSMRMAWWFQLARRPYYSEAEVEYYQVHNVVDPKPGIFTAENLKMELVPMRDRKSVV